jgi:hypothetical protein
LSDSSPGHFTRRERYRSPLKEGWVAFKAGLHVLEGKNISGIFRESNHDSLIFASSLVIYLYQGCLTKNDTRKNVFWHMAFTGVAIFYLFSPTNVCIL